MAHFLEYYSLANILTCNCRSFLHRDKPGSFAFLYHYGNVGILKVTVKANLLEYVQDLSTTNLESYEETRIESPVAWGAYDWLVSAKARVFKLNNRLKASLVESQDSRFMPRLALCTGFDTKKETEDNPGLFMIYETLLERAAELELDPELLPPRVTVIAPPAGSTSWQLIYSNDDGKSKKFSATDMKIRVCPIIEQMLHILNHYDPKYYYFRYKMEDFKSPTKVRAKGKKQSKAKK